MQSFTSVSKVRVFDELFCHVEDCINSGGENSFSMGSDSVPPGKVRMEVKCTSPLVEPWGGRREGGGSAGLSFK